MWIVWMVTALSSIAALEWSEPVRTRSGLVRGLRSNTIRYYGITYALAERFQAPRDPPKWDGVLNAAHRFGHCAQRVSVLTFGTEECLQLDVHTPRKPRSTPRPVLVFLHGGGYYYGTKAHYDPEFLVTKGVIVVIVNYRLGVFGFLCAGDVANLGLKDQVAALKWIRDNIAAFGGDPDNVTLSGQSAGASAAAMHLLSKSSSGLFHKAILMSGTALAPWAFNLEPLKPALEDAAKLTADPIESEEDIVQVFKTSTVQDILTACADVSTNSRYFKYSPCIDSNHSDPFFHDTPFETISSGNFNHVPLMVGATDVEGILFYGLNDDASLKQLNENFTEHLPSVFSWMDLEDKKAMGRKIRAHYFGNKTIDKAAVGGLVSYYSDWIAYGSMEAFVDLMQRYSSQPIYGYLFAYEGVRNFAKLVFGLSTGMSGASHSDDIFYVFQPGGLPLPLSPADRAFVDSLTTMIVDFMTHGEPTPGDRGGTPWRPSQWLRLSRSHSSLSSLPDSARAIFMRSMLCKYGIKGHAPCSQLDYV